MNYTVTKRSNDLADVLFRAIGAILKDTNKPEIVAEILKEETKKAKKQTKEYIRNHKSKVSGE